MSKINWWRSGRQTSMGRRGAINILGEAEYLGRDRAAKWIEARLSPKPRRPQRPATVSSSCRPPWK
jgi:hypothetical protein